MAAFEELVRSLRFGLVRPQITLAENGVVKLLEMRLATWSRIAAASLEGRLDQGGRGGRGGERGSEDSGSVHLEKDEEQKRKEKKGVLFLAHRMTNSLHAGLHSLRDNIFVEFIRQVQRKRKEGGCMSNISLIVHTF